MWKTPEKIIITAVYANEHLITCPIKFLKGCCMRFKCTKEYYYQRDTAVSTVQKSGMYIWGEQRWSWGMIKMLILLS